MIQSLGCTRMAKRKIQTASCRIEAELLQRANIVCAHRNIHVSEYISNLIRIVVNADYNYEIQNAKEAPGGNSDQDHLSQ